VARAYAAWLDMLVADERDRALGPEIEALGPRAAVTDTLMTSRAAETALARHLLSLVP
jgi:LPPG:FO 2-phospho-L-lactate transferase